MGKIIGEGITFDDVLLVPSYSEVIPNQVDLSTYLTKKIKDKVSFRATISTVWIFLNTLIMLDDIRAGFWTGGLLITQLISLPFLFAGMYIGSRLYVRMSQRFFMILTYILLFISGISLLVK